MPLEATPLPRCFVIQPFRGDFDKRFDDVLKPACAAAGLSAYRVDRDPTSEVPIETIEAEITSAAVCLADITEDNPNVWFEVGFAKALAKPICLICDQARRERFPFDVQHLTVTKYATGSPTDFREMQSSIVARLKALASKAVQMKTLNSSPLKKTEGLQPHEIAALAIIMSDQFMPLGGSTSWSLQQEMSRAGFTPLAASLATVSLRQAGLIDINIGVQDPESHDHIDVLYVTQTGSRWMLANVDKMQLRKSNSDDIPF